MIKLLRAAATVLLNMVVVLGLVLSMLILALKPSGSSMQEGGAITDSVKFLDIGESGKTITHFVFGFTTFSENRKHLKIGKGFFHYPSSLSK